MGFQYFKRPIQPSLGYAETVETVTSTGTSLSGSGMSIIAAATNADRIFKLSRPSAVGVHKYVVVNVNASTDTVSVRTASTADTFFGSTNQTLLATTGANVQAFAHFLAASTSAWALLSKSTGLTIS